MQLEKIISISGKPGLFKLVSQLKNGFIVEDVTSRKKVSIGNSSQVSLLDNIAMFTVDKEVPLFEVFENIAKSNEYKEKVYNSSRCRTWRERFRSHRKWIQREGYSFRCSEISGS